MKRVIPFLCLCLAMLWAAQLAHAASEATVSGELMKWHKVTLTFEGPETSETAVPNPFLDFKFDVVFTHAASGKTYEVPGYFAADGNAGITSADSGNKWRVHFAPDEVGEWSYEASFYEYGFVAVRENTVKLTKAAKSGYMHGETGSFTIVVSDKAGDDFRAKGRLQFTGDRYLKFAETGEIFFKCGPDAPENVLAYEDFDGNFHNDGHADHLVKKWAAHLKDWNDGDPTWGQDERGKALIGAMNYLSKKGMNAFSFLTMNIMGDDHNVFPYIDYDTLDRFDVSKLDQWEILFQHASELGIFLHFKTQEAENQGLLDGGGLGALRRLYYRELIARFGHNLALNWNMGEEIGEWQKKPRTPPQYKHQRLAMAEYFAEHDPYNHHVVIHNGNWFDDVYGADSKYTGASLQTHKPDFSYVHGAVLRILKDSAAAGKLWAVAVDEPGDAQLSLVPDSEDPAHDDARKNALWGAFMAGAWGVEWYFGYKMPHSDLTCEDWGSRDLFWDQCKITLDFLHSQDLPYSDMNSMDELIVGNGKTVNSGEGDYCLALPGDTYLVYLKSGDERSLTLEEGKYSLLWYNPRKGGDLQTGSVRKLNAKTKGDYSLGIPPVSNGQDWVGLLRKR